MKIAMLYHNNPPFGIDTHDKRGLGGSESGFINTVKWLLKKGHTVDVFNQLDTPLRRYERLGWGNINYFDPNEPYDVVYSLRHREPLRQKINAKLKVLFLADTESVGLFDDVRQGYIDLVMSVSHWQKEKISREEGIHDDHWMVTSNGVDETLPFTLTSKVQHKCVFASSPERGLDNLLAVWPKIREQVPDATLHLFSSTLGWGMTEEENNQMWAPIYAVADSMQELGVFNRKHVNALEMRYEIASSDLYLGPSDFYETCCMCVLEAMLTGTIPVVTGRAGLLEKVISGVTGSVIPTYGAGTSRYRELFIAEAVKWLLIDEEHKTLHRHMCSLFAKNFTYDVLVDQWVAEWQRRIS